MDRKYLSLTVERADPFSNVNLMEAAPRFQMAAHAHPFYHINRILAGSLTVEIDGATYELDAGCTFVLPPHRPHALYSESGYTQIGIDVECVDDSRGIRTEIDAICGGFTSKRFPVSAHDANTCIEQMRRLLSNPTKGNRMRAIHLAECQVLDLLDALRDENSDGFPERFAEMVAQYEPWRLKLSDMCRILCISRTQLERQARYAFGCGASEYCARLRYARVCALLKSDMTLDDVAEEAGFCDAAHLSRFFSARAGMTPGKYRKESR